MHGRSRPGGTGCASPRLRSPPTAPSLAFTRSSLTSTPEAIGIELRRHRRLACSCRNAAEPVFSPDGPDRLSSWRPGEARPRHRMRYGRRPDSTSNPDPTPRRAEPTLGPLGTANRLHRVEPVQLRKRASSASANTVDADQSPTGPARPTCSISPARSSSPPPGSPAPAARPGRSPADGRRYSFAPRRCFSPSLASVAPPSERGGAGRAAHRLRRMAGRAADDAVGKVAPDDSGRQVLPLAGSSRFPSRDPTGRRTDRRWCSRLPGRRRR